MAKAFKVIIAGGRDFNDLKLLTSTCDKILKNKANVEVVSGVARGADRMGEVYGGSRGSQPGGRITENPPEPYGTPKWPITQTRP